MPLMDREGLRIELEKGFNHQAISAPWLQILWQFLNWKVGSSISSLVTTNTGLYDTNISGHRELSI